MKFLDFKFIQPGQVRVRFAPAPSGPLHIGNARTALFNYLFARKQKGVFILRIENTDFKRSDERFEQDIMEDLKWLGIEWDEGPIADAQNQKSKIKPVASLPVILSELSKNQKYKYIGNYGPYRQNERTEIYAEYLKELLEKELAYHCFCSEEELETQRQYQMSMGQAPRYNGKCRQYSVKEVKKYLDEGKPSLIRFKVPAQKIEFIDLVRGKIEIDAGLLGDIAIARNYDKKIIPLYNFAVAVDDYEMKISHVIRGEDLLPNTPKQILLQEALGFSRPQYIHLPLILGRDRSKLSKRHGAISVDDYRTQGYLPEALVNFLAFLGWNPGTEREIFSMASLTKEFFIEGIQKAGASFNTEKLNFLNGFYIRQKSPEKLTELCLPYLIEKELLSPAFKTGQYPPAYGGMDIIKEYKISETGETISFQNIQKIVILYQERIKKLSEISELADFFFKENLEYDKDLLKWKDAKEKETRDSLDKLENILSKIETDDFIASNLEKILLSEAPTPIHRCGGEAEKTGLPADLSTEAHRAKAEVPFSSGTKAGDRGYLLWPFRVALSGKKASAGPFEIAEILGKKKTLKRIGEAKGMLNVKL